MLQVQVLLLQLLLLLLMAIVHAIRLTLETSSQALPAVQSDLRSLPASMEVGAQSELKWPCGETFSELCVCMCVYEQ